MRRIQETPPRGPVPDRPPYVAALIAGLATLALYVVTLAPTTQFWDTSEYIATAHIMGIPHAPGNPLFVVLARAWELLLA
ncbi:MAG: protein O-mannosyl-transferase family, partial [Longimicrobiales bacterium]